jgi:hypothetical protein
MAPPSVSGGQSAGVQMDDVEDEESQAQMLVCFTILQIVYNNIFAKKIKRINF